MDLQVSDREKLLGPLEHGPSRNSKTRQPFQAQYRGFVAPGEAIPFCFALAVCGGAMAYLMSPIEPHGAVCLGVFVGWAIILFFALANALPAFVRVAAVLIFGAVLGFSAGKLRVATTVSATQQFASGPVLVEGWLSAIEPGRNGVRIRIKTHAIGGLSPEQTAKTVRLTHRLDLRVSSGRFVRCWAILRPPPSPAIPGDYDFQRQAWFEELDAVGYVMGRCRGGVLGRPNDTRAQIQLAVASKRRQLARYTHAVSGPRAGGFAAALVSGDRSYISAGDQDALRGAGLAHLLAISGLHLGIVGGLVYLLFRRGLGVIAPLTRRFAIQKPAAIAAILAITAYLVLSGASVSTQRAYIMSVVFFSAILVDRPALSLRSFTLAMLLVVLLRPESVFSPGFQMSFAATGVLIAIYETWSRRRAQHQYGVRGRIWFWMQSLALTSIAASIATAPFAFYHFERLAPLGLIANLTAMPVVSLLSVPSAGLAIVLAPFGLSEWGLKLFGKSLELVLAISHWASASGAAYAVPVKSMPPMILFGFATSLASFVLFRRWLRWGACAVTGLGAAILWMALPAADGYWSPSGEAYLNLDADAPFTRISLVESEALGPLRFENSQDGGVCDHGTCTFELSGGQSVRVMSRVPLASDCRVSDPPVLILVLDLEPLSGDGQSQSEPHQNCFNVLRWQDIQRKGGARFQFAGEQVKVRHTHRCSARPWRQCPVP
ncbi:MAG: ComEC/Rec2 family competence protein [Hyphomonadaceae bacterium]